MSCKQIFLLFQREILSLSLKAICYINIDEKMVQNKRCQCLCSRNIQKNSRNPWNLPLIPDVKKCSQSYTNSKWTYPKLAMRYFLHAFFGSYAANAFLWSIYLVTCQKRKGGLAWHIFNKSVAGLKKNLSIHKPSV